MESEEVYGVPRTQFLLDSISKMKKTYVAWMIADVLTSVILRRSFIIIDDPVFPPTVLQKEELVGIPKGLFSGPPPEGTLSEANHKWWEETIKARQEDTLKMIEEMMVVLPLPIVHADFHFPLRDRVREVKLDTKVLEKQDRWRAEELEKKILDDLPDLPFIVEDK